MCRECIYFFNFEGFFGKRGTQFGVCNNKDSNHYQHILAHAHPICKNNTMKTKGLQNEESNKIL